ncbi:MAG: helix-turn-helix transcriptional regulator [Leptolyngbyaceae bacterium]|nr:helix-turn-helix transcriptional regulator [Leptolyngbyaceae bacterium]
MSQRVLAEKMGKSQSWVRDIENGRIKPNPKDQEMICKVLQIEDSRMEETRLDA